MVITIFLNLKNLRKSNQALTFYVEKNKHLRPNIWKLVVVDCSESIQKYRATNRSKIDAFTFDKIKLNQESRFLNRFNGLEEKVRKECLETYVRPMINGKKARGDL